MLKVETELKKSTIDGFGIFAKEFIPKGTVVWEYNSIIDVLIKDDEFKNLPKISQDYVLHYGHHDPYYGGVYFLCGDNARFTNHSETPNMEMIDHLTSISNRDINIGEELTEDYNTYDDYIKDFLKK